MHTPVVSGTGLAGELLKAKAATQPEDREFARMLEELDAALAAMRKTPAQKRQEEAEAEAKRMKEKKLQALRELIQQLTSRVNRGDESAAGQLACLKNQLIMLQMFG